MNTKEKEGFEELFQIAKSNIARARHIAMMIPVDRLDLGIIMEARDSKIQGVISLSLELALSMRKEDLNFSKLVEYHKNSSLHVSELAARLLLKHYGEDLTLQILFNMQNSKIQKTRDDAKVLALALPKDTLSLDYLMKVLYGVSGDTAELAKELANSIPVEKLEPMVLLGYQKIDSSTVKQFAAHLARKIDPSRFDYKVMLKVQSSIYIDQRYLCREIALNMPKECFVYEDLRTFVDHFCVYTKELATILLMKHFEETFNEEELRVIELSENNRVSSLAKELLLKIELRNPGSDKVAKDFVKKYFSD